MKEHQYDTEDLIAALATPWASSALAVIRTGGEGCIRALATVFSQADQLLKAGSGKMVYGYLKDREGAGVDQVMMAVFHTGHGYTGQESVEIHCHGSLPGIQRILELLRAQGFRDAAPGEFTLRAFLNGRMDLTRAEAVQEIVSAKTLRAQSLALNRLAGGVWRRIDAFKLQLRKILAVIELQLDYPEDELEEVPEIPPEEIEVLRREIDGLSATYRTGRLFQEGVTVALAGPTNAGKSSLFNLFLREDRSIVSGVHGTTRDYIESWISISGVPVRLFDTAGLRVSEHPVEAEGIRRSTRIIENAAMVIYIVDGTEGLSDEDIEVAERYRSDRRYLFVWNKTDLSAQALPEGWYPLSAETGEGFPRLEEELGKRILGSDPGQGEVMIDSRRQQDLLNRSAEALDRALLALKEGLSFDFLAADLKEALDALGEITGEVTSADILNQIFGDFCVGK